MIDGSALWLLLLGVVAGGGMTWLLTARLARRDADVPPAERGAEAAWIARAIEDAGGVAPTDLVEEVLDLHALYLASGSALLPPREDPA
ncbi:MAG: hypothetical protein ACKOTZ_10260 [Chloroflexota bacterium]